MNAPSHKMDDQFWMQLVEQAGHTPIGSIGSPPQTPAASNNPPQRMYLGELAGEGTALTPDP